MRLAVGDGSGVEDEVGESVVVEVGWGINVEQPVTITSTRINVKVRKVEE